MAIEEHVAQEESPFLGTDFEVVFTITDAAGAVQNVTGWALEWVLRRGPWDTAAVLSKTTASGIVLTTPMSGVVTVTVLDTDTDTLQARVYHHALRRTDAGSELVLSHGRFPFRKAAA